MAYEPPGADIFKVKAGSGPNRSNLKKQKLRPLLSGPAQTLRNPPHTAPKLTPIGTHSHRKQRVNDKNAEQHCEIYLNITLQ